jgi:hypothetical protein
MAAPLPAGPAPAVPPTPRLRLVPPSVPPTGPCARTLDAQSRVLSEHRTATERRRAHRRARTLCEDLAELLPRQTDARSQGAEGAYDLKQLNAEVRASAGELAFWATRLCDRPRRITSEPCPQCGLARCRCAIRDAGSVDLDLLVDLLDEQLGNAAHGYRDGPTRVLDLMGSLLAGIDAITMPDQPPAPESPPVAELRCAHCGSACDQRDDESGLAHCSAEHRLLTRIALSAATALRPGPVPFSTDGGAGLRAADAEA